jgi:hypothetical protein
VAIPTDTVKTLLADATRAEIIQVGPAPAKAAAAAREAAAAGTALSTAATAREVAAAAGALLATEEEADASRQGRTKRDINARYKHSVHLPEYHIWAVYEEEVASTKTPRYHKLALHEEEELIMIAPEPHMGTLRGRGSEYDKLCINCVRPCIEARCRCRRRPETQRRCDADRRHPLHLRVPAEPPRAAPGGGPHAGSGGRCQSGAGGWLRWRHGCHRGDCWRG